MKEYVRLVQDVALPKMCKVRQKFDASHIEDVAGAVREALARDAIAQTVKPGMSIALTCGSRGVANIALVLKTVAGVLRELGARPFIIPAMGSHGGACAEGQRRIVHDLGVTEEYCGCPIRATMETTLIGHTDDGREVRIDKYAAEADGIILVGRIKAHTAFHGTYESGLMKMMAIGLAKQAGAEICHRTGFKDMAKNVPLFGDAILRFAPVLFGVGLIENAYEDTCMVRALLPDEIRSEEPALLLYAKKRMGRILFDEADVLIIDEIGKNISGDGADPNVTGGFAESYASGGLKAQRRIALDLTDASHGNFNGTGACDAISARLYSKIDMEATYPNVVTSTLYKLANIPMVMPNDRDTIKLAVKGCLIEEYFDRPRIIRIKNTMLLDEIEISEALLDEARANPDIEILTEPAEFAFDANGNLF